MAERVGPEWEGPSRPWRRRCSLATLLRYCRCDLLAGLQGFVHRLLSRDRRRELLRAAVADVLELRNADVLHPWQSRSRRRARIVDRRGLHRVQRLLGERLRGLLVLRDLIGREARSRRNRRPAAWDTRPGCLDVV